MEESIRFFLFTGDNRDYARQAQTVEDPSQKRKEMQVTAPIA